MYKRQGDNVIEYTDGIDYYISIESTNGWGLESIKAEGDYSDLPVNYNSSYIYINQYAAPVDGNIYTINVYNKEAARTASFEVTVTDEDFNPNLLRVYRGNEYIIIDENPKTISFNPDTETEVSFGRTDYGELCSVKHNDVTLPSPGTSFHVADGDKVTITVSYPDVDLPVSFTLPEGCEDVLSFVQVDYNNVDNWADPDFAVRAGHSLQFQVNDNKYVIDHVYVNDSELTSYSNYYSIRLGQEALDIVIEAHPYATFAVTINADEPSRLKVTDYFGELLPLTGASTVLQISEKQPMITVKTLPDFFIESMTGADGNPCLLYTSPSPRD